MKRDGFGLVEILIASALLAFLIGGIAELHVVSLGAKRGADFAFAAARRAAAILERDKSRPFDSPELAPGTSSPAADDDAFPGRLAATRTVEAIDGDLKRIVVVVSDRWAPRKKQTYCLNICRELGF